MIMLTKLKKKKGSELIGILGEVISLTDRKNLFLSILQFLNSHLTQVGTRSDQMLWRMKNLKRSLPGVLLFPVKHKICRLQNVSAEQ